jgi:alpha-galactosidase
MTTGGGEAQSALADRMIDELKSLRELYLGDYYPLLPIGLADDQWCGWQFDRPELGRGFAMCFRRKDSPYVALGARLRGLDPAANYEVNDVDAATTHTLSGKELMNLRIEVPAAPGSALVTYRKLGQ